MKRTRQCGAWVCGLLLAALSATAQFNSPLAPAISSVSGQFSVSYLSSGWRPFHASTLPPDWVKLEPNVTAVSAERIKVGVVRELALPTALASAGKITLAINSSLPPDGNISIRGQPFLDHWIFRVELPEVLSRQHFARTIVAVMLINAASHDSVANGRAAEVPAWLVDGLARKILASDTVETVVSAPVRSVDGFAPNRQAEQNNGSRQKALQWTSARFVQNRQVEQRDGLDALAGVREVVRARGALTFQQLSWPEPEQLAGLDGGSYFASAQLFVTELLQLKNGAARLRQMLVRLPAYENWQTAFYAAFADDFRLPLDVEKWWSLRVGGFAARDHGPRWNASVCGARLAELLTVSVAVRATSNSLPAYMEISLQAALQTLDPAACDQVFRMKLQDVEFAQLRFAAAYAPLVAGYRQALTDFLGERPKSARAPHGNQPMRRRVSPAATLKRLDALDAQRRALDARLNEATRLLPGGGALNLKN
jgi:hypothetical protein